MVEHYTLSLLSTTAREAMLRLGTVADKGKKSREWRRIFFFFVNLYYFENHGHSMESRVA